MTADTRKLSRFTATFASGTFVSRVLGMIRDILWAKFMPTGSLDAFLVAFRLPNMLRDLVGEGAMNAAFIPVFSETLEKRSENAFRELVQTVMGVMLILLLLITFLGVVFIPVLLSGVDALRFITGSAPKTQENIALVVSLSRWTFPYIFFIGMTVFAMAPLMTLGRYAVPSWSPALLNVSIISCHLLVYRFFPHVFPDLAYALVLGVWLGGIAQLLMLYISLGRNARVWTPRFQLASPGVREILFLMLPVIAGQAAGEVNKLVDTLFAYSLEEGTVTALFYANRLTQLPLSMFGFATAAAVLPTVSAAWARGDDDGIRKTLVFGFRQILFLVIPSSLGLIVLGKPIVWLLFERGNFDAADTTRTATALAFYAAGLIFFALVKVAVTGFYGSKDTRTPVIIASLSMLLNIILNCLLVRPLGYRGLALATTISYGVNFFALYFLLVDKYSRLWDKDLISTVVRIAAATAIALAAGYALHVRLLSSYPAEMLGLLTPRLVTVAIPVLTAAVLYFFSCWLLRVQEVAFLFRVLLIGEKAKKRTRRT
ncbi:MAG TPA: murein biosynthesis integral membrane protein MurJ [Candidatus Hydrogenedentes bacterium]|nr:murein biosynthesis integral membrane protein MurJ [Candidatus Hydrogenedentota bacterium]HOL75966.1 murein biosynthesis integral membrane protein MurJ [Candidatus Hydrogenedentota bacterium]HPO85625.1 murein biosynthesis integral membrane protein MurJ [Candidatus Hydrogenedentota bacterium]